MSEIKLPTNEEIKQSWNTFVCKGKYSDTLFYEAGAIWMRDTYVLPLLEENTTLKEKIKTVRKEALMEAIEICRKDRELYVSNNRVEEIMSRLEQLLSKDGEQ